VALRPRLWPGVPLNGNDGWLAQATREYRPSQYASQTGEISIEVFPMDRASQSCSGVTTRQAYERHREGHRASK
jgi:hypothetical protein